MMEGDEVSDHVCPGKFAKPVRGLGKIANEYIELFVSIIDTVLGA
jgi:hypothetical protein